MQAWVQAEEGTITVAIAGLTLPLPTIDDGTLATVTFTAVTGAGDGEAGPQSVMLRDVTLGDAQGGVVPVTVEQDAAQDEEQEHEQEEIEQSHNLFLPIVTR